jgi:amino acid transporter
VVPNLPTGLTPELPYTMTMEAKGEFDSKTAELGQTVSDAPAAGDVFERRLSTAEQQKYGQTHRGLSPRNVQLMAIGGSIGTGLFVGIGSSLSKAGPLSVFLAYLIYGCIFIWPCNLCVAEMVAYLPVRGTIFELASRFVDPAFGFAMGWTYFYAGCMLVCAEYAAVATVMQYWNQSINPAVWVAMALVVCFLLNIVAVR